jgi:hypothetical protein
MVAFKSRPLVLDKGLFAGMREAARSVVSASPKDRSEAWRALLIESELCSNLQRVGWRFGAAARCDDKA